MSDGICPVCRERDAHPNLSLPMYMGEVVNPDAEPRWAGAAVCEVCFETVKIPDLNLDQIGEIISPIFAQLVQRWQDLRENLEGLDKRYHDDLGSGLPEDTYQLIEKFGELIDLLIIAEKDGYGD